MPPPPPPQGVAAVALQTLEPDKCGDVIGGALLRPAEEAEKGAKTDVEASLRRRAIADGMLSHLSLNSPGGAGAAEGGPELMQVMIPVPSGASAPPVRCLYSLSPRAAEPAAARAAAAQRRGGGRGGGGAREGAARR